jgi:HTH-type transcriptional regulator/antitoxin HigA
MSNVTPIRNEADYDAALAEVEELWGAAPGSERGDRLEVLMVLIADYEARHHAIDPPDPIEAVRLRMAEKGLSRDELAVLLAIGSGRVSEILNRRRRLTLAMIRRLAPALGLSERCLIQDYPLRGEVQRAPVVAQS